MYIRHTRHRAPARATTVKAARAGLLAGAALLLAACGSSSNDPATGTDSSVADNTRTVVRYAHQQEPACVFGGWIEQAYISYNVLDSLTSLDADGRAVPWLAERWSVSDDQLTWTFELKQGVRFTDGTPLDAEAVAYNFDYWLQGGNSTARVWLLNFFESAAAKNPTTLEITLSAPYPRLPETLTQGYFGIQSSTALQNRTKEENCAQPIGSGAFTVGTWNRGQNLELIRNDAYTSWPANATHQGPARIEKVDWRFVPDPTTRAAALRAGEVDLVYDVAGIDWQPLDDEGFVQYRHVTKGRPVQFSFNLTRPPFDDVRVRQAFAYGIDRKAAVETVGQGLIPYEGNGAVSRSTPGYSEDAANRYSYDPDRANQLLDEAGWTERDSNGYRVKDGNRLKVILPYGIGSIVNRDGESIIQYFQDQVKAIGFELELIPVPQSELFAGAYSRSTERDINIGYWTATTPGIMYINYRVSTSALPNPANQTFSTDAELEALIFEANTVADLDEQNTRYREAQEYVAERAYSIGIYARLSTHASAPGLKGFWQEHAQGGPVFHETYFSE
jgi:peptide/nickel transport system substrate-binding protein